MTPPTVVGGEERATATATARVIGSHPHYLQAAEGLGAKAFDIPPAIYAKMGDAAWAEFIMLQSAN